MFRFVPGDSDGLPHKRKQSQRACQSCRKRKKRCLHTGPATQPPPANSGSPRGGSERSPSSPHIRDSIRPSASPQTRFGGRTSRPNFSPNNEDQHLSPNYQPADASSSTAPTSPALAITRANEEDEDEARFVGDLNPEGIFLAATSPESTASSSNRGVGVWLSRRAADSAKRKLSRFTLDEVRPYSVNGPESMISSVIRPCLEDQCLRLLPSKTDVAELTTIYFQEIHSIFPVLDKENYFSMVADSPAKVLLTQAICLAASANKKSKAFYSLATNRLNSHDEFAGQLSSAIKMLLDFKLVKDKIVLIQVLALLSLFTQLSGDSHSSAELTSRTVSYVHTTGIHLQTHMDRPDHKYVTRLFCCVWVLDRLNAAFHGRPVLMHDQDCGRDMEVCFKEQEGCFQLFLRVVLLLDKVIALYRPIPGGDIMSWDHDFPTFEDLLQSSGATSIGSPLLATIESLYHAVAMLSYRSQSLKEPAQSSISYLRQCLSATRVISLVGEEFHDQLCLLPIVPYAISLALRIYYRDLRLSKAPLFRARSRRQLLIACGILRDLGEFYSSALLLVQLAEQTVHEMDKICTSMSSTGQHELVNDRVASHESTGNIPPSISTTLPNVGNRGVEVQGDNVHEDHVQSDSNISAFDPLLFDNMPADIDIFAHFDPNFNLNAIDAALGDNINPSFPMDLDFIYPTG
ncbi:hypothetical protein FQN52_004908 [Onygenales sp. PD_12]|nr:hypothetical protein FQN52_004908 [Onygenales sp. PD_12]